MFVLHEVEPSQVNSDIHIRLFFEYKFSELKGRRRGLDDWPIEEQLGLLCERAAGLFVYAVATVKFIDKQNTNPRKRLDLLVQSPENSVHEGQIKLKPNTTLDSLYMSILREAFGDDDPGDDPRTRSVLGAVVFAVNPLSPSTIATLLGFDAEDVLPLLSSVHSLLILQEDAHHPVRPFHKSFPDFIVDQTRCDSQRFRVSPTRHHPELLAGCLELMNRTLEKNMCNLPDAVANSEVDDLRERAERYLNRALRYACTSWHKHLFGTASTHALKITPVLHRFPEGKFLFWLEVVSVLGAAREAVDALDAVKWLDVRQVSTLDPFPEFTRAGPRHHQSLILSMTTFNLSPGSSRSSAHPPRTSITPHSSCPPKPRSYASCINYTSVPLGGLCEGCRSRGNQLSRPRNTTLWLWKLRGHRVVGSSRLHISTTG